MQEVGTGWWMGQPLRMPHPEHAVGGALVTSWRVMQCGLHNNKRGRGREPILDAPCTPTPTRRALRGKQEPVNGYQSVVA